MNHFHTLLLLRGLLAHGVLTSGLMERRWRVNYGVDANNNRVVPSNLAVPFRAKDSPGQYSRLQK